jgi:hypothetical protein
MSDVEQPYSALDRSTEPMISAGHVLLALYLALGCNAPLVSSDEREAALVDFRIVSQSQKGYGT